MTFDEWMRAQGLSDSSVKKYLSSVNGVMTDWAKEAGLLQGPLTSITSLSQFHIVTDQLKQLPIFVERNSNGKNVYSSALKRFAEYLQTGFDNDIERDIDDIFSQPHITETEKSRLVKTRVGQGDFRARLIEYWQGCALTHYQDPSLLVASHIKPWRVSTNREKLDHFNGLLLLPTLDKAFDAGFISFQKTGEILLSPQLSQPDVLGIKGDMKIQLNASHLPYMEYHRDEVFRFSRY
jgi:hypothetical protein